MNYCLYYHRDSVSNQIFYIGIGKMKRAWNFKDRNIHWKRYVKKHGYPIVEIIKENLNKNEAIELEEQLILEYGRKGYEKDGILVNITLGGEGTSGYKWDDERKNNHSDVMKQWMIENKSNWKKIWKEGIKNRYIDYNNINNGRKGKKVCQYDLEGNLIKEYSSKKDAENKTNIKITEAVRGKSKTAGGYIWKYQ